MSLQILAIVFATLTGSSLMLFGRALLRQRRVTILQGLFNSLPISFEQTRGVTARGGQALFKLLYRGRYRQLLESMFLTLATVAPDCQESFRSQKAKSLLLSIIFLPIFLTSSLVLTIFLVPLFFAPEFLLYNQVLKHKENVKRALPETIDLLSLCVDAGLTLTAALSRVGSMQGGAMGSELTRLMKEVQLGSSPSKAFLSLADRTDEMQIYRLVNALNQVDRLGAPLSLVLKEQGTEFREIKRARAREEAQKVPVKILGPIMLCFLPALLVIVIAPAILGIMESFSGF